jgi:hypothetical protein
VDLFRVDVTLMGFISHDQEERMQAKQSQTDAGKHSQMRFLPPFLRILILLSCLLQLKFVQVFLTYVSSFATLASQ